MFRIRRVSDGFAPANARALAEVEAILTTQFAQARPEDFSDLPQKLARAGRVGMAPIVFVAQDSRDRVRGAILAYRFAAPTFMYLDYLAVEKSRGGGGVGGALYQALREVTAEAGGAGLFFECLAADPACCRMKREDLEDNAKRLAFYARFGAYPIANTAYETPVKDTDICPPHLLFDACGAVEPLARDTAKKVVRAILERKYAALCPPEYTAKIVGSFKDNPVKLAVPKKKPAVPPPVGQRVLPVITNDKHDIFHVRERGYVEAPVRIPVILSALKDALAVDKVPVKHFPDSHVTAVHSKALVDFIKRCSASMKPGKSTYPYVFPIRNQARPPKDLALHAGYFCIDTFTPINANAWDAARRAADCALTAAELVLEGKRFAYALVRPPGHHAEHNVFGGFCYLNNSAIAAQFLAKYGKVAVLDIDYHHGNGTQDIFWKRGDVLTVSIHGHPSFAYPYFSGFAEEVGEGEGEGANLNLPLREHATIDEFFRALRVALSRIAAFDPAHVVIATGFDTAAADPTGSWKLRPADFTKLGQMLAAMGRPTVFVQEGGYRTRTLGRNAAAFFGGVLAKPVVKRS